MAVLSITIVVVLWLSSGLLPLVELSNVPDRASSYFCVGVDMVGVGHDDCDVLQGDVKKMWLKSNLGFWLMSDKV